MFSRLTNKDIRIVPVLPEVIKEDAAILLKKEVDFNRLFNELNDESQHIEFYRQRKNYYGDCYGYSDVIFAVIKYLELHRDKIPSYDQVLVDEFQDFNRLEVSLIELLSEKSPVLVAGDDDQALYDFKSASTEHIRSRHGDKALGYEPFNLPFCSRCTRVIVQAANDIIESAAKKGCLKGRIEKPFVYFVDKDRVSDENPTISYGQVWATKIPWAIEKEIGKVARDLRAPFSVLIISPYNIQSRQLTAALKNKGFEKLESTEKRPAKEPSLLDGLRLLVSDYRGNLGWRIVAKCLLEEKDFKSVLEETAHENARSMNELVGNECRNRVEEMLRVLKKLARSEPIDDTGVEALKKMGLDPYNIMRDILAEELDLESHRSADPAVRKIPVKATTIQGSKGLSADYVFITHFDDQYLIKNKRSPTDKEVCNFVVALTRARKKVFLISSKKKEPTFLKWIKKERIGRSQG